MVSFLLLSISNNVEDKTNGKIRVSTICLRNDAETNISMALVAFFNYHFECLSFETYIKD